jgi:hypothetical protein
MISDARYRSKKGGMDFSLTLEDVMQLWAEQDGRCALSGMPLTHHRRGAGSFSSPSNASLDRVAPTGPYSAENVQLVCIGVNLMRRKMELDEFVSWCRQVADHQSRHWRA